MLSGFFGPVSLGLDSRALCGTGESGSRLCGEESELSTGNTGTPDSIISGSWDSPSGDGVDISAFWDIRYDDQEWKTERQMMRT